MSAYRRLKAGGCRDAYKNDIVANPTADSYKNIKNAHIYKNVVGETI